MTELVPYRWAIRQLADELGCAADERAVVAATRGLDPPTWLATVCERSQTTGLVVDTGYPPPDEALPLQQIRAAGVDVAPLLRLESVAGDLIAEGLAFADLVERYDAAVSGARDAGYAGLKSIAGLPQRPRHPAVVGGRGRGGARRASARPGSRASRSRRSSTSCSCAHCPSPVATACPCSCTPATATAISTSGSFNPLHLRGMLASEEAQGVHFVILHGAWPYVREGAFMTAVYANVTLDIATCIPPLGHAALLEAWRCALSVGATDRIHASTDAAGLPEHISLGAMRARSTLGQVLAELVASGELASRAGRALRRGILQGNSRRPCSGEA